MTRTRISWISTAAVMLVLGIVIAAAPQQKPSSPATAETLMGAALHQEEVEGNLEAAIATYKKVIADARVNRSLKATALLHLGQCYEKLGDAEARKAYERVVREFSDQAESAATARARLAALASASPSASRQAARQVWSGAGVNGAVSGSVSPDGRYLSFRDPGTYGLAVRDLREGTSRLLTNNPEIPGGAFSSVFSPDGRQVAYEWATLKDLKYDLRILPFTGSEAAQPRIVHRNDETERIRPFDWTPDGRQLLVLRSLRDGTNQIAMVSVQDGSVRVLKSLAWQYARLSLSPDGRYLAYDAPSGDGDPTAPKDIFVLAADGSRETAVVQSPADDSSPLWSPDGSQIVFLSTRTGNPSLWRVPIEAGKPNGPAELVKADIGRIRPLGMTRSGTLYYLVSGLFRTNVYIAELDAGMKTTKAPGLATERFINSNSGPTWSPDGLYLAYLSSRGLGANGSSSTVLVIRTLKTGEERDLSMPAGVGTGNLLPSPRWFPDGRSVLVKGIVANYYRVDLATGNAELLHAPKGIGGQGGLGANAISPDGKTIFYIASDEDEPTTARKLVRFDIDSRRETVLKRGQLFCSLAVSLDGTHLAFVRNLSTLDSSLEVMPADGGETREVFRATPWGDSSRFNTLAWSPDQRYLLFVKSEENQSNVLWRVPVAGGEPEKMGISMAGQLMYPQVHPDGRRITFGLFEIGASEVWALENFLPTARAAR